MQNKILFQFCESTIRQPILLPISYFWYLYFFCNVLSNFICASNSFRLFLLKCDSKSKFLHFAFFFSAFMLFLPFVSMWKHFREMGHFYKLLCEEMIFLLHKGKNDGLRYEVIIFSREWFLLSYENCSPISYRSSNFVIAKVVALDLFASIFVL